MCLFIHELELLKETGKQPMQSQDWTKPPHWVYHSIKVEQQPLDVGCRRREKLRRETQIRDNTVWHLWSAKTWEMIRRQYIQPRAGHILILFPTCLEKDCHAQPCKSGLPVLMWKLIFASEVTLRLAQLKPCIGRSLKSWTWWYFGPLPTLFCEFQIY